MDRWRFALIAFRPFARLRHSAAAAAVCLAGACTTQVAPGSPASLGDPVRGRAYAQSACASCHAIEPDDDWSPVLGARSFESIANTPGMTARALNVWLHTSHDEMPDLIIEPDQIDDLAAYMETLED